MRGNLPVAFAAGVDPERDDLCLAGRLRRRDGCPWCALRTCGEPGVRPVAWACRLAARDVSAIWPGGDPAHLAGVLSNGSGPASSGRAAAEWPELQVLSFWPVVCGICAAPSAGVYG